MTFIQGFRKDFSEVAEQVENITSTENTFIIEPSTDGYNKAIQLTNYSDFGLKTLGVTVGFPAPFIQKVAETNPELAEKIMVDRIDNYFLRDEKPAFYGREFLGKIQGVVSNKYAYFDDDEVIKVLGNSPIKDLQFQHTLITPERLHLRAIDKEPFKIDGDDSNLFFVFFIDNSMVGQSSFKVRLGIFRQACSNGLIINQGEFTMCRQVHRGTKDISEEFNTSLSFLVEKKDTIKAMISNSTITSAKIEEMQEEYKRDYLAKKLLLSKKETEKVLQLYVSYGGKTKWAMTNAITEFARDIKDINRRTVLESKALAVA